MGVTTAGAPGGRGPLIRDRYGSIRITVEPSLISHPAVPKYVRMTWPVFSVVGRWLAKGQTTVAANPMDAKADFSIGKPPGVSPLAEKGRGSRLPVPRPLVAKAPGMSRRPAGIRDRQAVRPSQH